VLEVERGVTYTFNVEGGDDPSNPGEYHPFYITESEEGGRAQKSNVDQALETVYGGLDEVIFPLSPPSFPLEVHLE